MQWERSVFLWSVREFGGKQSRVSYDGSTESSGTQGMGFCLLNLHPESTLRTRLGFWLLLPKVFHSKPFHQMNRSCICLLEGRLWKIYFFAYWSSVLQCFLDLLFFYFLLFCKFKTIHLFSLFSTYWSFCVHTEDCPGHSSAGQE